MADGNRKASDVSARLYSALVALKARTGAAEVVADIGPGYVSE